ncbi:MULTISPECIES: flagellar hook-length control protein FliK [Halomonadaceae]|nr:MULTISPECIES: flagellar hook-length control protein FliK [Halomonas]
MHSITQLFLPSNGQTIGSASLIRQNAGETERGVFHQTMLEVSRMGRLPTPDDIAALADRGAPHPSLGHVISKAQTAITESSKPTEPAISESGRSDAALFNDMNIYQVLPETTLYTASTPSVSTEERLAHSIVSLRTLAKGQVHIATAFSAAQDTVAKQVHSQIVMPTQAAANTVSVGTMLLSVETIATAVLQAVDKLATGTMPEHHAPEALGIIDTPDSFNAQAFLSSPTIFFSASGQSTQPPKSDSSSSLTTATSTTHDLTLEETITAITSSLEILSRHTPRTLPTHQQIQGALENTEAVKTASAQDVTVSLFSQLSLFPDSSPGAADTHEAFAIVPTASALSPSSSNTNETLTIELVKITSGLQTLHQLWESDSRHISDGKQSPYPLAEHLKQISQLTHTLLTQTAGGHTSTQPTHTLTELDEIAQRISLVSSYAGHAWPSAQTTPSITNTVDVLFATQGNTQQIVPSSPAMLITAPNQPNSLSVESTNTWSMLQNVPLSDSHVMATSTSYAQGDQPQKPIAVSGETTTLLPIGTSTLGSLPSPSTAAQFASSPALISSPGWAAQLGQQLLHFVKRGGEQRIEMKLNPSDLGPLSISLRMTEQGTQAQFLSAHAHVRQTLEQAIPQLREMLAEQGITLSDTFVGDQGAGDERFEHQNRPGQLVEEGDMPNEHNHHNSSSNLVNVYSDGRVDLYA